MSDHPRDCEHGRQWGKCDTCDLIEEYCENSALRSRIRELEAENLRLRADRHSHVDLQSVIAYDSGRQAGAEAALRWSWKNLISTVRSPEDFVADGLRAVGGK